MWKKAMPYVNDVIIFSKTFKDHVRDLTEFFLKLPVKVSVQLLCAREKAST